MKGDEGGASTEEKTRMTRPEVKEETGGRSQGRAGEVPKREGRGRGRDEEGGSM